MRAAGMPDYHWLSYFLFQSQYYLPRFAIGHIHRPRGGFERSSFLYQGHQLAWAWAEKDFILHYPSGQNAVKLLLHELFPAFVMS
jgi:hypothetical protein